MTMYDAAGRAVVHMHGIANAQGVFVTKIGPAVPAGAYAIRVTAGKRPGKAVWAVIGGKLK
jgi:hypothetical protein